MENEQVQIEEKIDYSSADQERDIETASRSLESNVPSFEADDIMQARRGRI